MKDLTILLIVLCLTGCTHLSEYEKCVVRCVERNDAVSYQVGENVTISMCKQICGGAF